MQMMSIPILAVDPSYKELEFLTITTQSLAQRFDEFNHQPENVTVLEHL
jgi:hypothetical protein